MPSFLPSDPRAFPHRSGSATPTRFAECLRSLPRSERIVLTAHSGAGPLLPAVRRQVEHEVVGYLFVDAGLPGPDGASRLELLESSGTAKRLRDRVTEGLLPVWTDLFDLTEEMVHELIPDAGLRRDFIQELRPTPLAVYEPLPVFSRWPDAACGYVTFSPPHPTSERHSAGGATTGAFSTSPVATSTRLSSHTRLEMP